MSKKPFTREDAQQLLDDLEGRGVNPEMNLEACAWNVLVEYIEGILPEDHASRLVCMSADILETLR